MGNNVLVTDGQLRPSLAVVRSLGRAGYRVHACATRPRSLAGTSRYALDHTQVESPLADPARFVDDVASLIRKWNIDVLVPMSEESMLAVLPRMELLPSVVVPFAPLDTFAKASDKDFVLKLAAGLGIAVPEQIVVPSRAASTDVDTGSMSFPLVLKPSRSVAGEGSKRAKFGVTYAASRKEFSDILAGLPDGAFPLLIQRKIEGPGTGVFLLRWEGQFVAQFAHRRLREKPPSGGVSVLAESVLADPQIAEQSRALLEALDWQGPAMVEFKLDRYTGRHYLMEINGRFWGSLQLSIDAGVDFPRLLVDAALGRHPQPVTEYTVGVKSRWWWGEVDHLIARLRSNDGGPELGSRWQAVRQFVAPGAGIRNEVLRLGDPMPSLTETIDWFRRR